MLEDIITNQDRYCFSKGKPKFVGLNFSTSNVEKCNDFIKSCIPRETNIYRLILGLRKVERRAISKRKFETKKYEDIFKDDRILEVR